MSMIINPGRTPNGALAPGERLLAFVPVVATTAALRPGRCLLLMLIVVSVVLASRPAGGAPERHTFDLRDLAMMSDGTRATFERGETLFLAGDYAAALPILQQAADESPKSAIAFRRLAETFVALDRRDDAIRACNGALHRRASPMDFRVCVLALTSGKQPITPSDMHQALLFTRRAIELGGDLPFGYASRCDIAHRLGDVDMLNECTKQLQRIAPDHEETRRALALASSARHPFRIPAAWIALGLVCIATLVHAWFHRGRHAARAEAVAVGWLLLLLLTSITRPALAADPASAQHRAPQDQPPDPPAPGHFSQFPIDDKDPLSSVPPKATLDANPLQLGYFIMDLTERAETAAGKSDYRAALKYWQALAKATPDRSFAFAKLCATYEALGDWGGAVYSCAAVLERTGATLDDYTRYVGLMLAKNGDLTPAELERLDTLLSHLSTDATGKGAVDELACRIGARTRDEKRLAPCTASLSAHAPNHPNTVYYRWALAIARKDAKGARALLNRAREVSTNPDDLQKMGKETDKLASHWIHYLGVSAGGLVVLVSAAGLIYVLRRRSPRPSADSAASGAAA